MKRILLIVCMILIVFLMGCTSISPKKEKKDYSNKQITIYSSYSDEQSFYKAYGNLILEHFPGLDIQFVTKQAWGRNGTIKQPPDLIISFTTDYTDMLEKSGLMDLNTFIKKENYDLKPFSEKMLGAFTSNTGALYGLSPNVNVFGLFYNKTLFDELKIEYPKSGMDWYELLQLASRFNQVAGYESSSAPSDLLMNIAHTNKWNIFDSNGTDIVFNKPEWTRAIEALSDIYRTKSIAKGTGDLFFAGKSAMYEDHISIANTLINNSTFSWGIVPLPVNSNDRYTSRSVFFNQVLSVPTESTQPDLSWEIIKVLMSEEAVQYYSTNHLPLTVSTLKKYMNEYNGIDLKPFWEQSIDQEPGMPNYRVSSEFTVQLYAALDKYIGQVITREITAEESTNLILKEVKDAYFKERLADERE